MKKFSHFLFVLLAAALLLGCSPAQQAAPTQADVPPPPPTVVTTPTIPVSPERLQAAQGFITQLVSGDFEGAVSTFDETMLKALPADTLQKTWAQLLLQAGAFQKQGETRSEKYKAYDIVYVLMQFEKVQLEAKIVYDASGKISGLFFVPTKEAGVTAVKATDVPPYVNAISFDEEPISVGFDEQALPGFINFPKSQGPWPAVVLVHGSGPNDRDETIGPNKPFRDIAWGLASRGIVVLRYDKRTYAFPDQFTAELLSSLTVKEESIDDALAAVRLLRSYEGIDPSRIYVLGHSLGGMLAPRIGALDPKLAGLIIMAGAARPFEDIYLEQITYLANLDGTITTEEQSQIDMVKAQVAEVKDPNLSKDTPASQLPMGISPAYWLDLRGYNPPALAQTLPQRLLILQGERDYQVTQADYALWQAALAGRSNVEFHLYPDLNHLFMAGQGTPNPDEYNTAAYVNEQVITDIANWILK